MVVEFTQSAYKDYLWWQQHDPKKFERIQLLCKAIMRKPFSGIGKPEPLKLSLQGYWSRRIDRTHRLVYSVERKTITVISCRYHY
jgi:toxin YoeB